MKSMCIRYFVFILLCIGLPLGSAIGEGGLAPEKFQAGVKAYQEKSFEEAKTLFFESLDHGSDNEYTLFNLGLSHYQLGHTGSALAFWRRALFLNPDFSRPQKALSYARETLSYEVFNSGDSNWEAFRNRVLLHISLNKALALTLLFMVVGISLMLKYWGQRRLAIENEAPLPKFPTVGLIGLIFFLASISLCTGKIVDYFTSRATIVSDSVNLRSGPSDQDSSLLEIMAGVEVKINRHTGEWVQVTHSSGLSGWVPKQSLFHTTGKKPW